MQNASKFIELFIFVNFSARQGIGARLEARKYPSKFRILLKIEDFFSERDLKRIYGNNPAWSAWEKEIYGSTSKINPINRMRFKARRLLSKTNALELLRSF